MVWFAKETLDGRLLAEQRHDDVSIRRRVLGSDHVDTLGSMRNLANSYAAARRRQEALDLDQEAFDRMKGKVQRNEALSMAKAELTGDTIEDRLASLEKEEEVTRLLAELKAKRGA